MLFKLHMCYWTFTCRTWYLTFSLLNNMFFHSHWIPTIKLLNNIKVKACMKRKWNWVSLPHMCLLLLNSLENFNCFAYKGTSSYENLWSALHLPSLNNKKSRCWRIMGIAKMLILARSSNSIIKFITNMKSFMLSNTIKQC